MHLPLQRIDFLLRRILRACYCDIWFLLLLFTCSGLDSKPCQISSYKYMYFTFSTRKHLCVGKVSLWQLCQVYGAEKNVPPFTDTLWGATEQDAKPQTVVWFNNKVVAWTSLCIQNMNYAIIFLYGWFDRYCKKSCTGSVTLPLAIKKGLWSTCLIKDAYANKPLALTVLLKCTSRVNGASRELTGDTIWHIYCITQTAFLQHTLCR